jgi:type IV pilus assembly protein PilC
MTVSTLRFQYKVSDGAGETRTGVIEAGNVSDALRKLRRDGNYVLAIDTARDEDTGQERTLIPRRVSRKEILYATSELAVMVDTGITLSTALGNIIEQAENPSLVRVLQDLKSSVESGEDFSTALSRFPKLFDKTFVQLVKASEASGSMGAMLDRIVEQGRKDLDSEGKVRSAMAYPMVMLVASIAASIFLLTYVFPKFTPIFRGKGITLPLPTRIMIALSDALIGYWYLLLAAAACCVGGYIWFRRSALGQRVTDTVKLNAPVVGRMFRQAAISRSIRTLSTTISSGVPMLQAIRLSGQVSGNRLFEADWEKVADGVNEGQQIHECMHSMPRFPRSLVQMIASGEKTGRLGTVLNRLSDFYDRELENAIKTTTTMIEPIMVCFMGFVVGSIAMALLLPIFTLSRHVK